MPQQVTYVEIASMGPRPFGRGMQRHTPPSATWPSLQWGRDLSVAECGSTPGSCARRSPLQWGRDLSVAEWPSCSAAGPRGLRFNGAATFRSRNAASFSASPPSARSRFNGAATFRSRNVHAGREFFSQLVASMGPRPFGRGMKMQVRPTPEQLALQWGRDLSVAECGRRLVPFSVFQPASMGPRPFGRGM